MFKALIEEVHNTAKEKGWWDNDAKVLELLNDAERTCLNAVSFVEAANYDDRKEHADDMVKNTFMNLRNEIGKRSDLECISLMHSELSEAVEELRMTHPSFYNDWQTGKLEGWLTELVDNVIRIFDFVGSKNEADNFEKVLREKIEFNKTRPYRHGGKLA